MTNREKHVRRARMEISSQRLFAFFRAVRGDGNVFATKLIDDCLDEGMRLDDIVYTGDEFGYTLSIDRDSEAAFSISFGCIAGPTCGDGGKWKVKFVGDAVESISGGFSWIT